MKLLSPGMKYNQVNQNASRKHLSAVDSDYFNIKIKFLMWEKFRLLCRRNHCGLRNVWTMFETHRKDFGVDVGCWASFFFAMNEKPFELAFSWSQQWRRKIIHGNAFASIVELQMWWKISESILISDDSYLKLLCRDTYCFIHFLCCSCSTVMNKFRLVLCVRAKADEKTDFFLFCCRGCS